jgi:hypothetical protein
MIKNRKDFSFLDEFVRIEEVEYKRTFNTLDPLLIVRSKINDYQIHRVVESFERAMNKQTKDLGEGITQRYIRSKGKNRDLQEEAGSSRTKWKANQVPEDKLPVEDYMNQDKQKYYTYFKVVMKKSRFPMTKILSNLLRS